MSMQSCVEVRTIEVGAYDLSGVTSFFTDVLLTGVKEG